MGLIYPDGTFKSREKIIANNLEKPVVDWQHREPLESDEWFQEAVRRLEVRENTEEVYDRCEVGLTSDRPIAVGLAGDWHLGATLDYEMLKRDVEIMATHPLVRGVFMLGDLTDSAFFNPAQDEDMFSFEEQKQMMVSILDYIGKDKILAIWKGNHDHKWERKTGTSKYDGLSERYNCPVFYGNAFVDFRLNDIRFNLMGSHRLRGNSIYNNAHAGIRAHREVQGLDVAFCGHTHKRGILEQPVRSFDGARIVYGVVNGTYQLGSRIY